MNKNSAQKDTLPLLSSTYSKAGPNKPIKLGEETLTLTIAGEPRQGVGTAFIRFHPRPNVKILGTFTSTRVPRDEIGPMPLTFSDRGLEAPGLIISQHTTITAEDARTTLEWIAGSKQIETSGNDDTQVGRVLFHLANFLDFQSKRTSVAVTRAPRRVTETAIFHLLLEWSEYVIHISALPKTSEKVKDLREQGGFGITHLGEIVRSDNGLMSVRDVKGLIDAVTCFFSFARGAWSSAILPLGYDAHGKAVWELWNAPRGDSYTGNYSWFDPGYGHQLESLFPAFMRLWTSPAWHDAMKETIYWYLNSNYASRGIDAGIILTQTAIECLCFAHSVQNKKLLSKTGFRGLKAPDLFRLLFGSLDVPQEIPPTLPEITKLAKEFNWMDAPQALVEMRNKLVHPAIDNKGKFDAATFEAWNLGLWYIEMVVLRLCGYVGQYSNRLKVKKELFEVEKVPWAP